MFFCNARAIQSAPNLRLIWYSYSIAQRSINLRFIINSTINNSTGMQKACFYANITIHSSILSLFSRHYHLIPHAIIEHAFKLQFDSYFHNMTFSNDIDNNCLLIIYDMIRTQLFRSASSNMCWPFVSSDRLTFNWSHFFWLQMNFLVCQLLALFFASFFRSYLHTSKVTTNLRHAFGLTLGLYFGYFCFGQQAIHIAGLPAVCYIIIRTQNPQIVQR